MCKEQLLGRHQESLYCGKIVIPKYKDEEMHLVDGVHEPLISEKTYYQVLDVLDGNARKFSLKVACPENMPLRGFLMCLKCSRSLTGSASKGRNGHHYYYHCKSFCGVRYNAVEVNKAFEELLQQLVPKAGVIELFEQTVLDTLGYNPTLYAEQKRNLVAEITAQNNLITRARELLLDEGIEVDDFKQMKADCEERITRLEAQLKDITEKAPGVGSIEEITRAASENIQNLVYLYREADIDGKRLIIGSTFSKKWIFSDVEGRTGYVNKSIELIYLINNILGHKKTGAKKKFSSNSGMVPRAGVEPARPCGHWCLRPTRLPIPPSGPLLV
jgi:site-specific DNA recombinase